MYRIQLWSNIGEKWVESRNPLFQGGMDFKTARERVGKVQACKWQIVNGGGKPIAHGSAAN